MQVLPLDPAYACATDVLSKLKQTGTMVITDLDGTMTTGNEIPSERELSDRTAVRDYAKKKAVVLGAVTARTCALTLSSDAYEASESLKKYEWPPRWGRDTETEKRFYVPLEKLKDFDGCLNFDFTGSFGGNIVVKNGSGYKVDEAYYNLLRHDYAQDDPKASIEREPWRHVMMDFLYHNLGDFKPYISEIEQMQNYRKGKTDSAPLLFRLQYNFTGSEGLKAMVALKEAIANARAEGHEAAVRIFTVDESKPDLANPEKSRYTLYLIPWGGRKEKMINRIFSQLARAAERDIKDIRLLYAGDTLTDLRSGLYAGDGKTTFLLATGSRLAPYLMGRLPKFGDEDLSFLWPTHEKYAFTERLVPTRKKGVYQFVHKIRKERVNTVIIGDERYPGLTAPGSVHAFLEEFL